MTVLGRGARVVVGAAALARGVNVQVNDVHHEIDRVDVAGIPVFKRDERGRPRVLGIPFPRWIRGPRKD